MAEGPGRRNVLLEVIAALIVAGWAVRAACQLAGVSHMLWYRRQNPSVPAGVTIPHDQRAYPNRIPDEDAQRFLDRLNSEEFEELSVTQAWRRMLDNGEHHCSLASAHRIVAAAGQNGDRRPQRVAGDGRTRSKPVLLATAANQLWCWDITDIKGPGRQHLKLYTVMDVFSRKVVGHRVEQQENTLLAAELIERAVLAEWAAPAVLHADNGASMRAGGTHDLLRMLGIRPSHSRPRTSNDNPYIESLFKTVKYSLLFPGSFATLERAREYFTAFFADYNSNHRHTGLNGYTPDSVHDGSWPTLQRRRQETLDNYYRQHPERFRRPPTTPTPPKQAWINQPSHQLSQTA
ncbi:MAG TPA: IS3 family transposase [Micrococcaceae bacterium]|nr:IS3 family transposase [Micrococcaceae bacterium]